MPTPLSFYMIERTGPDSYDRVYYRHDVFTIRWTVRLAGLRYRGTSMDFPNFSFMRKNIRAIDPQVGDAFYIMSRAMNVFIEKMWWTARGWDIRLKPLYGSVRENVFEELADSLWPISSSFRPSMMPTLSRY